MKMKALSTKRNIIASLDANEEGEHWQNSST
jgi:hypothetical protein